MLLDDDDRASVDNSRRAFAKFFEAETRVTGVWQMQLI